MNATASPAGPVFDQSILAQVQGMATRAQMDAAAKSQSVERAVSAAAANAKSQSVERPLPAAAQQIRTQKATAAKKLDSPANTPTGLISFKLDGKSPKCGVSVSEPAREVCCQIFYSKNEMIDLFYRPNANF